MNVVVRVSDLIVMHCHSVCLEINSSVFESLGNNLTNVRFEKISLSAYAHKRNESSATNSGCCWGPQAIYSSVYAKDWFKCLN